jgi:uncharacterized membrane protein
MSNLIAVAYPDQETAETVQETLAHLSRQRVIELADAVVVTRSEKGKVRLHQPAGLRAAGMAHGALWGGVIGLLFLAPLFGMAIGAAAGGVAGVLSDAGVDDEFMKKLGHELVPGGAAVIVLVTYSVPGKVLPEIQRYGGTVIETSLDDEAEARLRDALAASSPAAATA